MTSGEIPHSGCTPGYRNPVIGTRYYSRQLACQVIITMTWTFWTLLIVPHSRTWYESDGEQGSQGTSVVVA